MPLVTVILAIGLLMLLTLRVAACWKRNRTQALMLSFYGVIYLGLVYQRIRWAEPPGDIIWVTRLLLAAGILLIGMDWVFEVYGDTGRLSKQLQLLKKNEGPLYEIVEACHQLSDAKSGALIILERNDPLDEWIGKGKTVDAKITRDILFSLFTPPGDLHDGAVIARGDRIVSAGSIIPLTQSPVFHRSLGTRHRAAVGLSEVCDALCLVVSEETGAISIADRGCLHYEIPRASFRYWLRNGMKNKLPQKDLAFYKVAETHQPPTSSIFPAAFRYFR